MVTFTNPEERTSSAAVRSSEAAFNGRQPRLDCTEFTLYRVQLRLHALELTFYRPQSCFDGSELAVDSSEPSFDAAQAPLDRGDPTFDAFEAFVDAPKLQRNCIPKIEQGGEDIAWFRLSGVIHQPCVHDAEMFRQALVRCPLSTA